MWAVVQQSWQAVEVDLLAQAESLVVDPPHHDVTICAADWQSVQLVQLKLLPSLVR